MQKIFQLSPHVADLIAAGEVVERPASVVKELCENSIDAGSTRIDVEIQNGGMTLIRVTDDGCGMERQDAQTAFLRHATSKLRTESDLAAIGTLGFRGEALAAISSVSRISLLTGTKNSREGTSLSLEGGTITACDPAACPGGTTILVRDLFYNTPARLKFMKSDVAEGSAVTAAVQRLALAHPEVAFRLLRDGQEQLRTAGDGQLLSAVAAVFGRTAAKEMTAVESKWESIAVSGFVSLPTASRGSRNGQFFFVNGRFVRSKTLTAALEEAYRNQILPGRFPACVLNLTLPLNAVDVNVHPAKTEVRFLAEKSVFDCVHYGVRSALGKAPGKKDVVFPAQKPAQPVQSAPQQTVHAAANPKFFRQMSAADYRGLADALGKPAAPPPAAAEALLPKKEPAVLRSEVLLPQLTPREETPLPVYAPVHPEPTEPEPNPEQAALSMPEAPSYRVIGEALDTYIIVEEKDAVLFIDKHAAHERILFEKLKKQDTHSMTQVLLAPIPAQLPREEAAILLENTALLRDCGYTLEDFGDRTVLIRAVPDDVDAADAEATLSAIAADLLGGKRADPDSLRDTLLHTIACKAAIKAGWHTEPAERDALIREVMTRDDLKYCPHGRPICIRMTDSALRRQFKRS